ncbi:MAG: hypothetical protein ACXQT5_03505 [Candidatus Syntropharchaeia archaeon]
MSGETISTAIITIASVICAAAFVTAVYPSIMGASAPVVASTNVLNDRIKTDIVIIHEANNSDGTEVYIWVKNVGDNRIPSNLIDNSDLFFGQKGNFLRIDYDETRSFSPSWNYSIENSENTRWEKGETIKITVNTSNDPVTSGEEYFVTFVVYNGVSDDDHFSV